MSQLSSPGGSRPAAATNEAPNESGVGQTPDGWRVSSTCPYLRQRNASVGTGMLALHHILETVVQLFKDQLLQLVGRLRAP